MCCWADTHIKCTSQEILIKEGKGSRKKIHENLLSFFFFVSSSCVPFAKEQKSTKKSVKVFSSLSCLSRKMYGFFSWQRRGSFFSLKTYFKKIAKKKEALKVSCHANGNKS